MNLETAANLGEALSGLAIMATLVFGLRQVMEVNRNRRYEISQTIAQSLENPLVQRGFATFGGVITKDTGLKDLMELTREQKGHQRCCGAHGEPCGDDLSPKSFL